MKEWERIVEPKEIQTLEVDFNDVQNGLVSALIPQGFGGKEGDRVRLREGDEGCMGTIHGILIVVRPHYETWERGER